MSNPYFRFKQFEVRHDRCAMKVGTDGVLLGAWVAQQLSLATHHSPNRPLAQSPKHILDIGMGSGLIALMLAQQFKDAQINGIDIDPDAVAQATDNFAHSPWHNRLNARLCDFENYHSDTRYDIIVCNPPFFSNSLKNPDESRAVARHNDSLPFGTLINHSLNDLLTDTGYLCIIIPYSEEQHIIKTNQSGCLTHLCHIRTTPDKDFKRSIMVFSNSSTENTAVSELTLETPDHHRSPNYQALTAEYYL